jgi:hypothetical protein
MVDLFQEYFLLLLDLTKLLAQAFDGARLGGRRRLAKGGSRKQGDERDDDNNLQSARCVTSPHCGLRLRKLGSELGVSV